MPKYRRPERFTPETPQPVSVTEIRESGGKRKGKSMKKPRRTSVSGNVTREMLENAPANAQVLVNSRGVVKMIVYRRES